MNSAKDETSAEVWSAYLESPTSLSVVRWLTFENTLFVWRCWSWKKICLQALPNKQHDQKTFPSATLPMPPITLPPAPGLHNFIITRPQQSTPASRMLKPMSLGSMRCSGTWWPWPG